MTKPLITCEGLWKVFGANAQQVLAQLEQAQTSKQEILAKSGHVLAVQDVSFSVDKGEVFVIMGLSGSGKSTLIRCLSRLISATVGRVLVDGQDILAFSPKELRNFRRERLSMVFQHFGLLPHRSVVDNVAFGLEVQGKSKDARRERALEVLRQVGLSGWEEKYPRELSGGMQQRVGIARALAVDPDILMFDEPFSALDPLIRREMQDELLHLQASVQKTILFITHDFLEAIKLGDRIAIMKEGQIVQMGSPADLVLYPKNDYVRAFSQDVPKAKVLEIRALLKEDNIAHLDDEASIQQKLQEHAIVYLKDTQGQLAGARSPKQEHGNIQIIPANTLIADAFPKIVHSDIPLPVIGKEGRLLGSVDRLDVMMAMA